MFLKMTLAGALIDERRRVAMACESCSFVAPPPFGRGRGRFLWLRPATAEPSPAEGDSITTGWADFSICPSLTLRRPSLTHRFALDALFRGVAFRLRRKPLGLLPTVDEDAQLQAVEVLLHRGSAPTRVPLNHPDRPWESLLPDHATQCLGGHVEQVRDRGDGE